MKRKKQQMPKPLDQKAGIHHVTLTDGTSIPTNVPNDLISGDGFYVSYNAHDVAIYGSDTTALVKGQMEAFYILQGNHMAAYAPLIDVGFDACMDYFETNSELISKFSDKPPGRGPSI
jgi:hypothetical protein